MKYSRKNDYAGRFTVGRGFNTGFRDVKPKTLVNQVNYRPGTGGCDWTITIENLADRASLDRSEGERWAPAASQVLGFRSDSQHDTSTQTASANLVELIVFARPAEYESVLGCRIARYSIARAAILPRPFGYRACCWHGVPRSGSNLLAPIVITGIRIQF